MARDGLKVSRYHEVAEVRRVPESAGHEHRGGKLVAQVHQAEHRENRDDGRSEAGKPIDALRCDSPVS